jgi:hypothetical protein
MEIFRLRVGKLTATEVWMQRSFYQSCDFALTAQSLVTFSRADVNA